MSFQTFSAAISSSVAIFGLRLRHPSCSRLASLRLLRRLVTLLRLSPLARLLLSDHPLAAAHPHLAAAYQATGERERSLRMILACELHKTKAPRAPTLVPRKENLTHLAALRKVIAQLTLIHLECEVLDVYRRGAHCGLFHGIAPFRLVG